MRIDDEFTQHDDMGVQIASLCRRLVMTGATAMTNMVDAHKTKYKLGQSIRMRGSWCIYFYFELVGA